MIIKMTMRRPTQYWIYLTFGAGVGILLLRRFIGGKSSSSSSSSTSSSSFSSTSWTDVICGFFRRGLGWRQNRKLKFVGHVTRLCLYPVKACNGVYVTDAYVGRYDCSMQFALKKTLTQLSHSYQQSDASTLSHFSLSAKRITPLP